MSLSWSQKFVLLAAVTISSSFLSTIAQAQTSIWRCNGILNNPNEFYPINGDFEFYDDVGVVRVYRIQGNRRWFSYESQFSIDGDIIVVPNSSGGVMLDKRNGVLMNRGIQEDMRMGYGSRVRCRQIY
jgi:hypothetical protein